MRGRLTAVCLLVPLAAGCQAPPARIAACDRRPLLPRGVLAVRQGLTDTLVETRQHPLQIVQYITSEPAAYLRAAAAGLVRKRLLMNLAPYPGPVAPGRPALDPDALEEELVRISGEAQRPAAVRLYLDGGEALAALEDAIDQATCRVDVLMYLWDSRPLGREVAGRLAAWAGAGPGRQVRVLVDGGGNLLQGEPKEASAAEVNEAVCWLAHQPRVEVIRTRNPCFHFDHRKLVVSDGRIAWDGGRNFLESSFVEDHDLSFTVVGPLAHEMDDIFEASWREQGGAPAPLLPPPPAPPANAWGRLVATGPRERLLARALYRAVDEACHHVYVENPYFSDGVLQAKLARARRRGVDVRVIMTLGDPSEAVNRSNRITANRLLRAGIRVYIYPGKTHVKATSVDGRWAYVGTGNFDNLSLRHNRELGLAVGAGPVLGELEGRLFVPDLVPAWELKEPLPVSAAEWLQDLLVNLFL